MLVSQDEEVSEETEPKCCKENVPRGDNREKLERGGGKGVKYDRYDHKRSQGRGRDKEGEKRVQGTR